MGVTVFERSPLHLSGIDAERFFRLHLLNGGVTDEAEIRSAFVQAQKRFGLTTILAVNYSLEGKPSQHPIRDMPLEEWRCTCQHARAATIFEALYDLGSRAATPQQSLVQL